MVFCPEHPKRDQNLKFTPLRETTSIPAAFIWESPHISLGWAHVKFDRLNQQSNLIVWVDLIGIRFGTCKVRRLNRALQTEIDRMRSKEHTPTTDNLKIFSENRLTKKYAICLL